MRAARCEARVGRAPGGSGEGGLPGTRTGALHSCLTWEMRAGGICMSSGFCFSTWMAKEGEILKACFWSESLGAFRENFIFQGVFAPLPPL